MVESTSLAVADASPLLPKSASALQSSPPPTDDKQLQQAHKKQQVVQLLQDLQVDAGDIVVFDRACSRMNMYGAAICVCAKFFGNTPWDHNGVVVRDPHYEPANADNNATSDASGGLYLLEATLTGVKMRPLAERILRSQSHEVALRKLQVQRSDDFVARVWDFAQTVLHSPYEDRPQMMFNAGVKVPTRSERERLFDLVVTKKRELAALDSDLTHRLHMPAFERNALAAERERVYEHYHALVAQLAQTERSMFENARITQPHVPTKMFCSQLTASLYQHLQLLLPYPSANSYLPKHFASSVDSSDTYLKLQQDAVLLPELSLRRNVAATAAEWRVRALDAAHRAPTTPDELATIVQCLRRHQFFHALSDAELEAIAIQFRRRTLMDHEVVFYQGTPGDFFYVVERGECDVFVDYDHLRQTQEGDEHLSNPTTTVKLPLEAQLQRRTTLSLPDFQDASSKPSERVLVATNGPGSAFGESALVYDTLRRATLRASTRGVAASSSKAALEPRVVLWQLDKRAFKAIVDAHPTTLQHSLADHQFLLKAISDHPLFSALDARAKALAVRKLFPLDVAANTQIITQGASGDYFYVIDSGKCEIARRKPTSTSTQTLTPFVDRVIGRGATFGEAALLYNSRRGASVTALEPTRVWCMDRASFLTITRSGSAALLQLFARVSSASGLHETFVTQRDVQRILRATPTPTSNATAGDVQQQPSDRAVQLGFALLFHDASGVINFSQFAHFHIALGASNVEQLLPEAAFRILKALAAAATAAAADDSRSDNNNKAVATETTDANQGFVRLSELFTAMQQWTNDNERSVTATAARRPPLSAFAQLLDVPLDANGDAVVTQDDLARAIAALSEVDDADDADDNSSDLLAAQRELRAFTAVLKRDIDALRTIWHAAELRAGSNSTIDGAGADATRFKRQQQQQPLTFATAFQSGWIAAIRHNPTGSDWASLQQSLRDTCVAVTTTDDDSSASRTSLWPQLATITAAAIGAGVVARTVCAPLERLKILMQLPTPQVVAAASASASMRPSPSPLTPSQYRSFGRGLVHMVQLSGTRSLFSGNGTHCLWVSAALPTTFVLCDVYKQQLDAMLLPTTASSSTKRPSAGATGTSINVLAGGFAGLTAHCLLYPLDVVRGRLSVQQFGNPTKPYAGISDALATIYRQEGVRAFYRGVVPASVGAVTSIGATYALYAFLRPNFVVYDTDSTNSIHATEQLGHPSVPGQILCATTASLAAQTLSHPFDLVKRRLQLQGPWHPQLVFPTYTSAWHCARSAMRDERRIAGSSKWSSWRGLYRGLWANAVKALPSAVVAFVTYEQIRELQAREERAYEA